MDEQLTLDRANADRRCWSTLAILTFTIGVATLHRVGVMALLYTGRLPNVGASLGFDNLEFWLRTMSTVPKAVAAFALIWISNDLAWRRRGFFYLLCTLIDCGIWTIQGTSELGLDTSNSPILEWLKAGVWLQYAVGTAVGWAEFQVLTGMVGEIAKSYGDGEAEASGRALRSLASFGMLLWSLFFLVATPWGHPGALRAPRITPQVWMLWHPVRILWTICLIRLTFLCFRALTACGNAIAEDVRQRRKAERDPFESL